MIHFFSICDLPLIFYSYQSWILFSIFLIAFIMILPNLFKFSIQNFNCVLFIFLVLCFPYSSSNLDTLRLKTLHWIFHSFLSLFKAWGAGRAFLIWPWFFCFFSFTCNKFLSLRRLPPECQTNVAGTPLNSMLGIEFLKEKYTAGKDLQYDERVINNKKWHSYYFIHYKALSHSLSILR